MGKYNFVNQTKYSDKAINIVRSNAWEKIHDAHFVKHKLTTDYPTVSFHVNGYHLNFSGSQYGSGTYYLKNNGLHHSSGKISGWWKFSVSLKDLGIIDDITI